MPHLYLVIGARAAGKTRCLSNVAASLDISRWSPFAILEESIRDAAGFPLRIAFIDARTGDSTTLATRAFSDQPFAFHDEAFSWALTRIKAALARSARPIILDEVGPLEIIDSGGLRPALDLLLLEYRGPLVLSLRPALLPAMLELARGAEKARWEAHCLDVETSGPVSTAKTLSEMLEAHCT